MSTLRGCVRFTAAMLFVAVCILLVMTYFHWVRPEKKHALMRSMARLFVQLCGIKIRIQGEVVEGPVLVLANHSSFFDIFALTCVKPARFIAKAEIKDWPIFGQIAKGVDTLFIKRQDRRNVTLVNQQISQVLSAGQSVILFPEGKCTNGLELAPFRPSLIEPAVMAKLPVQPIAICYEQNGHLTSRASYYQISIFRCLWNIVTSRNLILRIEVLPPIETEGKTRHAVAAQAAGMVSECLGVADPTVLYPPPVKLG